MVITTKPLLARTAADLMTERLVLIPKNMPLASAAQLLAVHQISGAPVIDEEGVCVGVLSVSDFVRLTELGGPGPFRGCAAATGYYKSSGVGEFKNLPENKVVDYMTPDPVTVAPDIRISELSRMMVDAHIHRIIVVDEFGRPRGVVSSTDILAALASASVVGCLELEKGACV